MTRSPLEDHLAELLDANRAWGKAHQLLSPIWAGNPNTPRYVSKRVAIRLLEIAEQRSDLLLGMSLMNAGETGIAAHSLKVASVMSGLCTYLGLSPRHRLDSVMTALLHHLGQSTGVVGQQSTSAVAQRSLMALLLSKHSDEGHYRQVLGAFQHGLTMDGTGVPKMDFPVKQHPISLLLTVANDFIELCADSVAGMDINDALQHMSVQAGKRYHPNLISLLKRVVGPAPVGSVLQLKSGEQLLVTQ